MTHVRQEQTFGTYRVLGILTGYFQFFFGAEKSVGLLPDADNQQQNKHQYKDGSYDDPQDDLVSLNLVPDFHPVYLVHSP